MNEKLLNLFTLENISIESKACVNFLNSRQVCQSCVDTCPTNAIRLVDNTPVINQSKCLNCGKCVSECSVLAIDHVQKPYIEIYNQVKKYTNSMITCDELVKYQKGIKVPCYLYLDLPLLLQYGNGKEKVAVNIDNCDKCHRAGHQAVAEHLRKLQKEIDDLQIPIIIQPMKAELDDTQDQAVEGLTRRELFQKYSLKKIREAISKEGEADKTERTALSLKDRVLFKRSQFNDHLQKQVLLSNKEILPANQFLNIPQIEACTGCNICEEICPTDALKWNDDSDSRLQFFIQDCIACRKCSVCPEHSIRFEEVTFNDYLNQGVKVLKTLQQKTCSDCGESFRTEKETQICFFCEAKKEKDPMRFFV